MFNVKFGIVLLSITAPLNVALAEISDGRPAVDTTGDVSDIHVLADKRGLTRLRTYVVGETSYAVFQEDFGEYFTGETSRNPSAVPGYILRPLFFRKRVGVRPGGEEPVTLDTLHVPDAYIPYASGIIVLGFKHPDVETEKPTIDFVTSPEHFTVIALLTFKDGVLAEMELADVPEDLYETWQ